MLAIINSTRPLTELSEKIHNIRRSFIAVKTSMQEPKARHYNVGNFDLN